MITRRSLGLYSKGLIATGEQDQELGALVHSKQPWRHSCSKTISVLRENQELNKTKTLRRVMAAIYRVLGITPQTRPLMGPNTIHGPTDQKTVS